MPDSVTLEQLEQLAHSMWRELPPQAVIWLSGELGTGKTTFAQMLTRAAGAELATSPTFALVKEYDCAAGRIVHADCYRLRSPEEAIDMDLDTQRSDARLIIVEWPERAGPHVPPPTVHLHFDYGATNSERSVVRAA